MAKKKYEESNIQAIAETIRSKTGTEKTYDSSEMASGVNEVYDKGRTDGQDDFWAKYQAKGEVPFGYSIATYMFAGARWNDETFFPKYNINLNGAPQDVFIWNSCTNLKQRLEDCGVRIMSTSSGGITSLAHIFKYTKTTELPPIYNVSPNKLSMLRFCDGATNLIKVPYYDFFHRVTDFTMAFANCSSLVEVEGIDFSSATVLTNIFYQCGKLTTITVYGTIPISISFSSCPLSVESMKSIVLHLKNYAGTSNAGAYTLTLKDECKTTMANLGAIPELNNKTYDAYLTDIGWNLA